MAHVAAQELVAATPSVDYVVRQTEELLQRLVEYVEDTPAPLTRVLRRTSEAVDEIIFEADIGGMHYYLVRSQLQADPPISLSPRELAIAQLIAKGMPNKCIGEILDISQWTVATHLRRIFVKLGVTSRAAMVAKLVAENLL